MSPKIMATIVANIKKMVRDNNKHLAWYLNTLNNSPLVSRADIEAIKRLI